MDAPELVKLTRAMKTTGYACIQLSRTDPYYDKWEVFQAVRTRVPPQHPPEQRPGQPPAETVLLGAKDTDLEGAVESSPGVFL